MTEWAMAIDLDRCTGCEACVVACREENNVPVSGALAATRGRVTEWLRVERTLEGEFPDVRMRFKPVLCVQCDDAPCVKVCPVSATYETSEGLNAQIYPRCIGTRVCAHACPYTVRFFNWSQPSWEAPLEQTINPDVAVRWRGIMEKCTFCLQRIRRGKDHAREENRAVGDGEIQPACGDRSNPESAVARLFRSPRAELPLEDLGTGPRVAYLKEGEWSADGESGSAD
jgi:Fe-S-cluster-containing dehydrogenase component